MRWTSFALVRAAVWLIACAVPVVFANAEEPQKYTHGPDSTRQANVPRGTITKGTFAGSKVFEGTIREYAIYVPADAPQNHPLPLMVFQDGHTYLGETGDFRVPVVFDNLIAKKELPPIVAVFVNPGHKGTEVPKEPWKANNRSVEYDSLGPAYSKFLIEEFLPVATKGLKISDDPDQRAICGISSGGICAFTVAWERPDSFRKVMSHVGSFTDIRGGYVYPTLIRKTDAKPLKVFLQANEFDVDNQFGNWFLANQQMASSFKFKHYRHRLINGKGPHNGNFGGTILPDSLRWLWGNQPDEEKR